MAEIKKSLKGIWLKSMEAISNTASSIASNTKYKVDEMNIVNRRREILSDFGAQAYELWQKGEHFPESLEALLRELSELDEALNAIRTEKLAGVKTDEDSSAAQEDAQEETAAGAEDEADQSVPGQDKPVSSVSEKIDSAVETMGETIRKLGNKIEGGIEALSRAMKPKPEEKPAEDAKPAPDGEAAGEEICVEETAEEAGVPVIEVTDDAAESEPVSPEPDMPQPRAPEIELPEDEDKQD